MPAARRSRTGRIGAATPRSTGGPSAPSNGGGAAALTVAVAFSLVTWIVAGLFGTNWAWGISTLGGLPALPMAGLAALAIVGFVPAVARPLGELLERAGNAWRRRPRPFDALATVAVGLLLLFARDPVRFAGDSDLRLHLITSGLPAGQLFQQAFPLDVLVNAWLPRTLLTAGLSAEWALQAVGALVGMLFTAIALAAIRTGGARGAALPACAVALLGGGYVLALPGYDKFGPLMVGIALAALGAAGLKRSVTGAWTLAAGAAACVFAHRTGYVIAAFSLLAFGIALRGAERSRRASLAAAAVSVALACALMLPRAIGLLLRFDVAVQRAASIPGAGAGTPAGALLVRLGDALNTLFFLFPLWPVGAVAAWRLLATPRGRGTAAGFGLEHVAALAALTQLVVMFAARGPQGAARDWDIHTGAGVTVALGTCLLLARATGTTRGRDNPWVPLCTTALAIALSFWTSTMVEGLQLRRIERFLSERPSWNEEQRARAFDFLGWRDFGALRFEEAAGRFEQAAAVAPNPRYFHQAGLAWWHAGNLDAAARLEREATVRDPAKGDPWWVLAAVARASGDSAAAAALVDSARARGSRTPPAGLR